jgi:hypothetical protein
MALPRKTPNSVRYARMASRGCLTRLALLFNADPGRIYSGKEVTEILLQAVMAGGSPEERMQHEISSESGTSGSIQDRGRQSG